MESDPSPGGTVENVSKKLDFDNLSEISLSEEESLDGNIFSESDDKTLDDNLFNKTQEEKIVDLDTFQSIAEENGHLLESGLVEAVEVLQTRITDAMTRFTCNGQVGMGMSEYLDQIRNGQPAGIVINE